MEAFSDGVIAIIISIMVLELKTPTGVEWEDLRPILPVFLSYVLSFMFLGTYWNNHHHLLQASERVNGKILWANLHLLFWLSLIPFTSAWMGEFGFQAAPVACYGFVMLFAGCAYFLLSQALISHHDQDSALSSLGRDYKGKISLVLYAIAIPIAFWVPLLACGIFVAVDHVAYTRSQNRKPVFKIIPRVVLMTGRMPIPLY